MPDEIRQSWGVFKFYSFSALVIAISIYLAFSYGNQNHEQQKVEIKRLNHTVQNLSAENQSLTNQLNLLHVELEIQRLAAQRSQTVIEQGLNRESDLKQELLFYQKVMAPELEQDGFVIEAAEVKATASESVYRLEIVLIQQDIIKSVIKGNLDVTIKGSQNNKPVTLKLLDLLGEENQPVTFSFKYFQVIEKQLTLPEGFIPETITVDAQIYQFKRKRGELKSSFPWQIGEPSDTPISQE